MVILEYERHPINLAVGLMKLDLFWLDNVPPQTFNTEDFQNFFLIRDYLSLKFLLFNLMENSLNFVISVINKMVERCLQIFISLVHFFLAY